MRVLLLSAAHPPDDVRVVRKEGAALVAAGHAVRHLCPGPPDAPAAVAGVALETYRRGPGWRGRLSGIPALARRAAEAAPDAIHASEPDAWVAAVLAGRWLGARVVLDVHEHYPSRLDSRLPPALRPVARGVLRLFCRLAGRLADAVVVAKDGLAGDFGAARAVVAVRNYAEPPAGPPRAHRAGPLTLAHLGAMAESRGWRPLLEALALGPPDARLLLIGRFTDGSEAAFRARAAALGLDGRITHQPWLPQPAALALLATADVGLVLFQPGVENHRLALPHKLFDCMAAGLPVIAPAFATEVAGVVRTAGCGELIDVTRPETIAAAILRLSDPARRARLGAAGRAAVLGRFAWAPEAAGLAALYDRLAMAPTRARRRRSPPATAAGATPWPSC